VVTLTASWQKVFSDDPRVGYFSQGDVAQESIDSGELSGQALEDAETVVTNTTVDGVLSVIFALLVVIVIVDAARVCVKSLRNPESVVSHEEPYHESSYVAPAQLIATKEEKDELEAAGLGSGGGFKPGAGPGSAAVGARGGGAQDGGGS
jgi:carbon starvation protein